MSSKNWQWLAVSYTINRQEVVVSYTLKRQVIAFFSGRIGKLLPIFGGESTRVCEFFLVQSTRNSRLIHERAAAKLVYFFSKGLIITKQTELWGKTFSNKKALRCLRSVSIFFFVMVNNQTYLKMIGNWYFRQFSIKNFH